MSAIQPTTHIATTTALVLTHPTTALDLLSSMRTVKPSPSTTVWVRTIAQAMSSKTIPTQIPQPTKQRPNSLKASSFVPIPQKERTSALPTSTALSKVLLTAALKESPQMMKKASKASMSR